jgi:hypothetical protein
MCMGDGGVKSIFLLGAKKLIYIDNIIKYIIMETDIQLIEKDCSYSHTYYVAGSDYCPFFQKKIEACTKNKDLFPLMIKNACKYGCIKDNKLCLNNPNFLNVINKDNFCFALRFRYNSDLEDKFFKNNKINHNFFLPEKENWNQIPKKTILYEIDNNLIDLSTEFLEYFCLKINQRAKKAIKCSKIDYNERDDVIMDKLFSFLNEKKCIFSPQCLYNLLKSYKITIEDLKMLLVYGTTALDATCFNDSLRIQNGNLIEYIYDNCKDLKISYLQFHILANKSTEKVNITLLTKIIKNGYLLSLDDLKDLLRNGILLPSIGDIKIDKEIYELCAVKQIDPPWIEDKLKLFEIICRFKYLGYIKKFQKKYKLIPNETCMINACDVINNIKIVELLVKVGGVLTNKCVETLIPQFKNGKILNLYLLSQSSGIQTCV